MADNDEYNDEYQFADLDMVGAEPEETQEYESRQTSDKNFFTTNSIQRNVLFVFVALLLAMLVYKFLGSFFTVKKMPAKPPMQTNTTIIPKTPTQPQPVPKPAQPAMPDAETNNQNLRQKLSALEISQQGIRSQVNAMSNQFDGVAGNVNDMAVQIQRLNDAINHLNAKLDAQSREISQLMVRPKPKTVQKIKRKPVDIKKYYIQAVIPGRAWLISSKGTTLTVREGSSVPGYGKVKFIDPNQGRILMSSGQVIKFSQDDS